MLLFFIFLHTLKGYNEYIVEGGTSKHSQLSRDQSLSTKQVIAIYDRRLAD
jgi:hypothetical protein